MAIVSANHSEHELMRCFPLHDLPESKSMRELIDNSRLMHVLEWWKHSLKGAPHPFDATRMEESELLMTVPFGMVHPHVVEAILSQFGFGRVHYHVGGMTVTKHNRARVYMLLYDLD